LDRGTSQGPDTYKGETNETKKEKVRGTALISDPHFGAQVEGSREKNVLGGIGANLTNGIPRGRNLARQGTGVGGLASDMINLDQGRIKVRPN